MFWKKNKPDMKKTSSMNKPEKVYDEGMLLCQKITLNEISEAYNKYQLEELLKEINNWFVQADIDSSTNLEQIKANLNKIKAKIQILLREVQQKEIFLKEIDNIEEELPPLDVKLQQLARNIPKTINILELEKMIADLRMYKDSLADNSQILKKRKEIVLDHENATKYERINSLNEILIKKTLTIEKSILEKNTQLETELRTDSIAEERKKMFTWADMYESRLQKFQIKAQKYSTEIEDIEQLTTVLEYQTLVDNLYKDAYDTLQPPNFKNPEVQAQISLLAKKLTIVFDELMKEIKELKVLLIRKTIEIIADKRTNRLERLILRSKRHNLKLFNETLHTWDESVIAWFKLLNDTEPLRFQEPAIIAFSVERLSTFKITNLHEYLQDAMIRFTTFEWETQHEIQNQLFKIFVDMEKFST